MRLRRCTTITLFSPFPVALAIPLAMPTVALAQPAAADGRASGVGVTGMQPGGSVDPTTRANPGILGGPQQSSAGTTGTIRGPGASSGGAEGEEGAEAGPVGNDILDLNMYDMEGGYGVTMPEFHVVESGDTLWGISDAYFRDPYQWPKLWSFNESITNAHWIFPGDRVRLMDGGDGGVGGLQVPSAAIQFEQTRRLEAVKHQEQLLDRYAFVDQEELDTAMEIYGAAQAKVMVSLDDIAYISYDPSNPPVAGERLAVFAPTRAIHDVQMRGKKRKRVKQGPVVGQLVEIVGEVFVQRVAKESAEVRIVDAMRPIERGFKVGELRSRFSRIRPVENQSNNLGSILTSFRGTAMIGELDIFVINLGSDDGVRRGNILEVIHKGDEYSPDHEFKVPYAEGHPRRVLAEVMVVQVQQQASLAIVLVGLKEIEKGDPVEMRTPALGESEEPTISSAGSSGSSASGSVSTGAGSARLSTSGDASSGR